MENGSVMLLGSEGVFNAVRCFLCAFGVLLLFFIFCLCAGKKERLWSARNRSTILRVLLGFYDGQVLRLPLGFDTSEHLEKNSVATIFLFSASVLKKKVIISLDMRSFNQK